MKINFVPTLVACALSALIAYGLYSYHQGDNKLLLSAGSFLFLSISMIMAIGVNFDLPRTTTNIRVISSVFFAIAFICNLIFTFINFSIPSYVIINGILLLVYILIAYSINRAKQ